MKILKIILISLVSIQITFGLDMTTEIKPKEFFENVESDYNTGYRNAFEKLPLVNLFSQSADVATSRHLLAEKNSFDFIKAKIKGLGGKNDCEIETEDITNIFLTTPAGVEMKQRLDKLDKKISYPTGSGYRESCIKVLKCYGMTGYNTLTSQGSLECKNLISTSYLQEINKAHKQVNIQKPIINPDMFFNGIDEVSSPNNIFGGKSFSGSWDIMNDFHNINSLIFKDPKTKIQTDEDMYLTAPPSGGQCKKACGFDEIKDGIDKALLGMNSAIGKINNILSSENIDKQKLQELKTQLKKLQETVKSNSKTFDSLAQGTKAGGEKSYKKVDGEEDEGGGSQKIDFEGADTDGEVKKTGDNLQSTSENIGSSTNSIDGIISLIETAEKENKTLSAEQIENIKKSINSIKQNMEQQHTNLTTASSKTEAIDKVVKLDTMLCVQVCWVETSKPGVKDGGKVYSIEEIIDQYYALLTKVKDSGAMMKQKVTDEFWETSLQDLKLKNLVNIDFVIVTKPVFDNKTLSNKIETNELEVQKIREATINQATKLQDTKEKNKYLVLYSQQDRKLQDATEKNIDNLVETLEKQKEVYDNLKQNYAKVHMRGVNTNSLNKIDMFMTELSTFTEQMGILFKSFKGSSDAFLNNIRQGAQ